MATSARKARVSVSPRLPAPDKRVLAHPPLEVAIFEARLLGGDVEDSPEFGLRLLESVRAAGWNADRAEPVQQQAMQLQLAPQGPPTSSLSIQSTGWQLVEAATTTSATVFPQLVAVQAGKYETWETSFRPVVKAVLSAVAEQHHPAMRQRVALRYVDRLVSGGATTPGWWQGRVVDALLGPIALPLENVEVLAAQQQLELALAGGHRAVLRHGPFADAAERGTTSYLIDIDVSDTTSAAFDVEQVLAVADDIAEAALRLFHVTITGDYLDELRGES